jgi:hypothetical protein
MPSKGSSRGNQPPSAPLASEEDIRSRLLTPWLKQLGFDNSELRYETRFTVTLGREFDLPIGERRRKNKHAYSDIVCYHGKHPLFVVEVKRDDEPLDERARRQAISYARLLPEIAPFAVTANSWDSHLYDTVSGDEITNISDSNYSKNHGVIGITSELRSEAARLLIGFSASNLLHVCRRQHTFYLEDVGGTRDDEAAVEYEPRLQAEEAARDFLASDVRCFALVGPSGVGKSMFMARLVREKRSTLPFFYYDARVLTGSLIDTIAADFGWLLERDISGERVISRLGEVASELGVRFTLVVDGVDDHPDRERLAIELDQLFRRTNERNIRLCVTVRETEWHQFLSIGDRTSALVASTYGTLPPDVIARLPGASVFRRVPGTYLSILADQELDRAWRRYQLKYHIRDDLRGELREHGALPFSMRMIAEASRVHGRVGFWGRT